MFPAFADLSENGSFRQEWLVMSDSPGVLDHASHTAYSEPGAYAPLLDQALEGRPDVVAAVSALARNLIVHYRASGRALPEATAEEINLRWLADILATDQARHPVPLDAPRELTDRVQGCCRDHTLLSVGALRQRGIPARSRIGFASYFAQDWNWNHDHVIVEAWLEGRWRRFDPEIEVPLNSLTDPTDIPAGPRAPFLTAAEVWLGHRDGSLDAARFGVDEALALPGLAGAAFVHASVIGEVAHRFGDELLLWDQWGARTPDLASAPPADLALADQISRLLLIADTGDEAAERDLLDLYLGEPRLRPAGLVQCIDPLGGSHPVDLSAGPASG